MNQEVTLKISPRIIQQATLAAAQKKHRVEEVLSDWLESLFQEKFTDKMPDEEILALTRIQISPEEQERLSELLYKSRESGLSKKEQRELDLMVEISERNLVKKSAALRIAVERSLIKPLSWCLERRYPKKPRPGFANLPKIVVATASANKNTSGI